MTFLKRKHRLTRENLLLLFFIAAVPVICAAGVSPIPSRLRAPLIVCCAAAAAVYIIFKQKAVRICVADLLFLLSLGYMLASIGFSLDIKTSAELTAVYLCSTVMLFLRLPDSAIEKIISLMRVFSLIIALSVILSFLVEDCMNTYFSFIVNPNGSEAVADAIRAELKAGAYSGLAREKGEAALIMNIGICSVYAKLFSGKRFRAVDAAVLFTLFCALILTSKRALLVCPFVSGIILLIFLNNINRKKALLFAAVSAVAVILISLASPDFSNIFGRFILSRDEILTDRAKLWEYSFEMFSLRPMFGFGLGSYNGYLLENDLSVKGEEWSYYGHNAYLELLGELGLFGSLLIWSALAAGFVFTVKALGKRGGSQTKSGILIFSFSIQLMMFIYSVTGNTLLNSHQIFLWFFAVSIALGEYDSLRQCRAIRGAPPDEKRLGRSAELSEKRK